MATISKLPGLPAPVSTDVPSTRPAAPNVPVRPQTPRAPADGFSVQRPPALPAPSAPVAPVRTAAAEAISRELDRVTGSRATEGNVVEPMIDGENALPQILSALGDAKKTLYYESYMITDGDKSSGQIVDALIAAKQRGVEVRVVADAFGSRDLPFHHNGLLQKLKDAGVQVQDYNPINGWGDTKRDHRKTIVIDGTTGFLGGMNTADKYMGGPEVDGRLHDSFARVRGPEVARLSEAFATSWTESHGAPIPESEWKVPPTSGDIAGVRMRTVLHDPHSDTNAKAAYLTLINGATTRINVENSFPMDPDVVTALSAAARRGVEVRYIVGTDDNPPTGGKVEDNFAALLAAGVHIFRYPDHVHTKSLSVDGQFATIGSANVDKWSMENSGTLFKNREIVGIVEDPGFTQKYDAALFDRDVIADHQGKKTVEITHWP